jgi:hypothetical protein
LGDSTVIAVQVKNVSGGARTVYLHDVILIPVDEWACDAYDEAWNTNSIIGRQASSSHFLDIDSTTSPKPDIRALGRAVGGKELVTSIYKPISPSKAILQANTQQRLWFLAARGYLSGTHTGAANQAMLTDSTKNFIAAGVRAGMVIYNTTDGSSATITAVTATTIAGTLAGGAENDWDASDAYYILCPNWVSDPWICSSVQINAVARYLSMRGAS